MYVYVWCVWIEELGTILCTVKIYTKLAIMWALANNVGSNAALSFKNENQKKNARRRLALIFAEINKWLWVARGHSTDVQSFF